MGKLQFKYIVFNRPVRKLLSVGQKGGISGTRETLQRTLDSVSESTYGLAVPVVLWTQSRRILVQGWEHFAISGSFCCCCCRVRPP
jgi:hypothetical protein